MDYQVLRSQVNGFGLRPFNVNLLKYIDDRISAGDEKLIVCLDAFPGSGKTFAALTVINHLVCVRKVIDERATFIYVPRVTLRDQFQADSINQRVEWSNLLEIGPAWGVENGDPFFYRSQGQENFAAVSCYSSLESNTDHHLSEIDRAGRSLLILDECDILHETSVDGDAKSNKTSHAVKQMIERADVVLLMTGTFFRNGNERILDSVIQYEAHTDEHGKSYHMPRDLVRATYAEGIGGSYLRQFCYYPSNHTGTVQVIKKDGTRLEKPFRSDSDKHDERMLGYAVRDRKVWTKIVDDMAASLLEYRQSMGQPEAVGMVLIPGAMPGGKSTTFAESVQSHLKIEYGLNAVYSLSTESDSDTTLRGFREQFDSHKGSAKFDVLIAVGKAHVGFSQPAITHMALLTHVRSLRWMIQAIMRAGRVCYWFKQEVHAQTMHLFGLDDPEMMEIVKYLREEQRKGMRDRKNGGGDGGGESDIASVSVSIESQEDRDVETNGTSVDRNFMKRVEAFIADHPYLSVDVACRLAKDNQIQLPTLTTPKPPARIANPKEKQKHDNKASSRYAGQIANFAVRSKVVGRLGRLIDRSDLVDCRDDEVFHTSMKAIQIWSLNGLKHLAGPEKAERKKERIEQLAEKIGVSL